MYYTAKTIYNGLVAVPEKIVKKNIKGLVVSFGGRNMTLSEAQLRTPYERGEELPDKWGREPYRLLYFKWQPDTEKEEYLNYFK